MDTMNIIKLLCDGSLGDKRGKDGPQRHLGTACRCEFWFRPQEEDEKDQVGVTFSECYVLAVESKDDGMFIYTRDMSSLSNQNPRSDGYVGKFGSYEAGKWWGFFTDEATARAALVGFVQGLVGKLYSVLTTTVNGKGR